MIPYIFSVSVTYACFLFSLMTDCTYCLLFVRLCKTKANDDALEVVADFDGHSGVFSTS